MKILVVDDEKKIADLLEERFQLRGFVTLSAYDGKTALYLLRKGDFDGVVLDLRLPDIDGIEVLRQTMKEFPHLRVVVLSGHGNEEDFQTCLELGARACFHKPTEITKLTQALGASEGEDDRFTTKSPGQD